MLGIDARAARVTWTVFLIALSIGMVYAARKTIILFVIALFFAYMLSPLVEALHRYTPKRVSKTLSLAVVYLLFLTLAIAVGIQLGERVTEQATVLSKALPNFLAQGASPVAQYLPGWLQPYVDRIILTLRTELRSTAENALPLLRSAGGQIASIAGSVGLIVLVPILGFFFLKDSDEMHSSLLVLVPEEGKRVVSQVMEDLHFVISKYIRALVLLSLATFTSYTAFFELTGVPYSVLLAAIAAPLEFIPVIGPLTASIIITLVSAFSGYAHVGWIVIFLLVYRVFQDYVLSPYLMSSGVELHPLLVIFGVLAGEQIGGVMGMFLSVPLLAIARVIFMRMRESRIVSS